MLIALAALVVPDIGVAKSITFQAEDFVNSDGGNYTSAGLYGDTYQVSATKHNISLRCCFDFVGTYYGGPYLGFDPHYGFISVEDMPEGISVTAVEINFGNIDYLPSNKLSLWTSDGKPNYVSSIATFPVVTANNTLTQNKDVFADYVSNGTSRIEVPAANYFFIAQYNDKYGDPVKINSVTIEYSESSSLAPEILFSTPPQFTNHQ